jgi:opacity protein-like surface antigen
MCVVAVVGALLGAAGPARSEPYFALFGGIAMSESTDLEDQIQLDGVTRVEGTLEEVDLDDSLLVGGKFGYFLTRPLLFGGHLGAEVEFHYTQPHAPRQDVTFRGTSQLGPITSVQHADFDVYAIVLSALYRQPLLIGPDFPYGRLQPYVGLGAGAFVVTMQTRTSPLDANRRIHDTDAAPGLQVTGGLKIHVLRNVAVFMEYRFVHTAEFTFRFEERGTFMGSPTTETARDRTSLTQHQIALGLAVHW